MTFGSQIFVFDIETIPDVQLGRRLYSLHDLSDREVAQAMLQIRRQQVDGSDFVRLHMHQIVAISAVLSSPEQLRVWSLGETDANEAELIQRFFKGIERYAPTLISWNGSGFDLPVIHYRALMHGISAPRYWETGENDQAFRWNNYLSRYHQRHTDLMDVLSGYQARATAPLDEIAVMLGLPGKMGMSGYKVWDAYQAGNIEDIRNYCETDVLNTYLIYLRYQLISGRYTTADYDMEIARVKTMLQDANKAHLTEFLDVWQK